MGRRIIRRRRQAMTRRVVVRRPAPVEAPGPAALPKSTVQTGSKILVATSNSVRNMVLPKLATFDDVTLAGLANSPENALKILIQEHPDVVLLDIDFGEPLGGLDTARLMQKTRGQTAILMLVTEVDPEIHRRVARRFGSSWSYMKKATATRENLLSIALKSSVRGVQWLEPELSRPLAELWKIATEARDLEMQRVEEGPIAVTTSMGRKSMKNSVDQMAATDSPGAENTDDTSGVESEDGHTYGDIEKEVAPGIKLQSTLDDPDDEIEGIEITSISVGKGGVGQGVNKVRRTG